MHFISYLKEGRHLLCDFFALGAFSGRVGLFCKPLAFLYGISMLFHWKKFWVTHILKFEMYHFQGGGGSLKL